MRKSFLLVSHALAAAFLVAIATSCGSSPLVITITAPPNSPADGVTAAVVDIKITQGDKPVPDANSPQLTVTVDKGQFAAYDLTGPATDDPTQQSASPTVTAGDAKVELYSRHTANSTVTVTYSDQYGTTATKTGVVTFGSTTGALPASVKFVSATPASIGLEGASGPTTSNVVFEVDDASGAPVGDGVNVTFVLSQNPGGATIAPLSAATANGTGQVQTVLSAGTIPGTVIITATTGSLTHQSDPIAIAGGRVNFANFSLVCDNYSIGGYQYFGLQNTCTVFAADVNKQFVPNTQVTLMSEAGGVPTHITTQQTDDPSNPTDTTGEAQFPYQTQCPIPIDVSPKSGEFNASCQFLNQCHVENGVVSPTIENRTCNPRDGWATLVAYTVGEECYDDRNGNGTFDPGEEDLANCDLGEPFLDENDNGVYDGPNVDPAIPAGEPFYDYDGNGVWTGPNGKWDAQWPIWRKVTVVWTGDLFYTGVIPTGTDDIQANLSVNPPECTNGLKWAYQFADENGNSPTAVGLSDSVDTECGSTRCITPDPPNPYVIPTASNITVPSTIPVLHMIYDDSFTCDGSPPPPPQLNISISATRTLSTSQGTATQAESIFTDAAALTGTFQ